MIIAYARSLGRRMVCACILALMVLAVGTRPSFAATIRPIAGFKNAADPSVAFSKAAIDFYGLRIKETKEDVIVSYKGKQIEDISAVKIFQREPYLTTAYVVDDYPRQGLRTLFVPIFTGGANCCNVDIIVTKTESALLFSVVASGSGHGIEPDAVKHGDELAVSSVCAKQTDLASVNDDVFGWCTATAPRPDACLVFDDNAWRFARPGEKAAYYDALLQKELGAATDPGKQPHEGDPLDKEIVYANAVTILFYSIMAGKSDAESSNFLHQALPGLDAQHRRNFIANVKKTIARCNASTTKTISLAGAGSLSASSPPDAPPRDNASVGGRFARTPCGSIADTGNKLEWFVGPDVDMTFEQARDWTKGLAACGQGWALPTIAQLATLHDPRLTAGTGFYAGGKHWPAHVDPIFSGIGGGSWAWSREEANAATAKAYNFNQGTETRTAKSGKGMTIRAFAVRSLAPAP